MNDTYVFTGGGTGGHIFPALAIADALKKRRPDAHIVFIGAEGRMETRIVPRHGYPLHTLPIRGLQRGQVLPNLTLPWHVIRSLMQARKLLKDLRPRWVVGTGGYASLPVGWMAHRLGIPLLIQEQNFYPGLTNRLLGRWARYVCVPHADLKKYFPRAHLQPLGNPVRPSLLNLPARQTALQRWELSPERLTIGILGGSLGAVPINEAIAHLIHQSAFPDVQWIWQTGRRYTPPAPLPPTVRAIPFIDRMEDFYAAADIVIARAGAITLAELAVTARPAILIPSPHVAEDHQTRNAQFLVQHHAALMVPEHTLPHNLHASLHNLLNNPALRAQLAHHIHQLARPHAAQEIAELLIDESML